MFDFAANETLHKPFNEFYTANKTERRVPWPGCASSFEASK